MNPIATIANLCDEKTMWFLIESKLRNLPGPCYAQYRMNILIVSVYTTLHHSTLHCVNNGLVVDAIGFLILKDLVISN